MAARNDHDLVLITARSAITAEILSDCRDEYRDIVVVDDYDHPKVNELILETALCHRPARIISSAETDVLRAAKLRSALSLPGQDLASATAYRDKFYMKSLLAQSGLPVAPMREVTKAYDLRNFVRAHGLPIVVKPRAGGGSVGVKVLADEKGVDRLGAQLSNNASLIVETFIDGDFFTVDGLMAGGHVLQMWPSRTSPNLLTVAEGRPLLSWMLPGKDELNRRIRDFVEAVVRSLPSPSEVTAFHAEVFHTTADRLVLCEIACRPGGCGHVPVYEHALGVNLYAATLRGQAGCSERPIDLTERPKAMGGFAWFPPRAGILRRLPQKCALEGAYRYSASGRVGTKYVGATSVADSVAQVLVKGPPDRNLEPTVRALVSWWEEACIWEAA